MGPAQNSERGETGYERTKQTQETNGKMVSLQKRFLAFMLAFAMIFTNVGTDLHVSFAASGNKVDFTIGGADLVDAIRQAIEDEMWYHRTAWILPTVPQKSLKHCSLETERYMKSIRTSRETAWRQS